MSSILFTYINHKKSGEIFPEKDCRSKRENISAQTKYLKKYFKRVISVQYLKF